MIANGLATAFVTACHAGKISRNTCLVIGVLCHI